MPEIEEIIEEDPQPATAEETKHEEEEREADDFSDEEEGGAAGEETQPVEEKLAALKVADLKEEELETLLNECRELKNEGNTHYSKQEYNEAIEKYTSAIDKCPIDHKERAIFFNNRATCFSMQGKYKQAILDCNNALKLDSEYLKCLLRRAQAHEAEKDLPAAFDDYEAVLKLDSSNSVARGGAMRLERPVKEQREKEKAEMLAKLKDVGNQFLGLFGMSVDQFSAVKDPNTGSYSISMKR